MEVPFIDFTREAKASGADISAAIAAVINSGKYILGEKVSTFEEKFANYCGSQYGIGVNSGTDALKIALVAYGIRQGDEVITVPNTAIPTVSAIRETGATPVFVDINEHFTIDVSKIEKAITPKTKAIIPVHLYGQMCDMEAIMKIAKKHNLIVIEDCAQATGASFKNKRAGSFGHAACFSFYPTKNLGAIGDGGMIVTSDEKIARTAKMLRMYGTEKTYCAQEEGFNSRLDEMQAAILLKKIEKLEQGNKRRQEIAQMYLKEIENPKIALPLVAKNTEHVFHLFVIRTEKRDDLKKYLAEKGIGCAINYPFPVHLQPAYTFLGYKKGDFSNTEKAAEEILSIPIFPELRNEEVNYVIEALNAY